MTTHQITVLLLMGVVVFIIQMIRINHRESKETKDDEAIEQEYD